MQLPEVLLKCLMAVLNHRFKIWTVMVEQIVYILIFYKRVLIFFHVIHYFVVSPHSLVDPCFPYSPDVSKKAHIISSSISSSKPKFQNLFLQAHTIFLHSSHIAYPHFYFPYTHHLHWNSISSLFSQFGFLHDCFISCAFIWTLFVLWGHLKITQVYKLFCPEIQDTFIYIYLSIISNN